MPSVTFRKTRMTYYNNQFNRLTKDNANTKITINTPNDNDQTLGYAVARIKNADHQWHAVPFNNWGLYLCENEWISLLYNNKMIIPKHIKISLGHTIPIARYPTGSSNVTGLSFNNTIFSLIYENHDTMNVLADEVFNTDAKFEDFFRTYDGATFKANKRNVLPQPDLLYKVPDYRANAADTSTYTRLVTQLPGSTTTATNTIIDEANDMSVSDLKLDYLPEFLKDDNNVSVLYPGENQYVYEYTVPDNDANKIDLSAGQFNESYASRDVRGQNRFNGNLNAGYNYYTLGQLRGKICPRVRNTNLSRNTGTEYANRRNDDIYFDQSFGFMQDGPPEIYIKGCPILDPDSNLVFHSFFATVTWELELEVVPNDIWIPRPLIEGWTCMAPMIYNTLANTAQRKARFFKPYPRKLQPQGFMRTPHKAPKFTDSTADVDLGGISSSYVLTEMDIRDLQRFETVTNTINIIPSDQFAKITPPAVMAEQEESEGLVSNLADAMTE